MRMRRPLEVGLTSVEVAVVFPVVLAILAAGMHIALLFLADQVVDDMATTVLEHAVHSDSTTDSARIAGLDVADQEGFARTPIVNITETGEAVRVSVEADSYGLVPGLPTHLSRTIEGPKERFVAESGR